MDRSGAGRHGPLHGLLRRGRKSAPRAKERAGQIPLVRRRGQLRARFASQDSIRYWLDRAVETGFNRIVVDVKPVEGDVLYKSDFMTELTDFRGTKTDRTWDYLQFFLDEAARRDLEVTVSTTIFPAGLTATRQGPVFRDAAFDGRTCIEYMPDGTLSTSATTRRSTWRSSTPPCPRTRSGR